MKKTIYTVVLLFLCNVWYACGNESTTKTTETPATQATTSAPPSSDVSIAPPTVAAPVNIPLILIECDERGNMKWGDKTIKNFDVFKQLMTAELKKLQQGGAKELPDCTTKGCMMGAKGELLTIFDEIKQEVLKGNNNTSGASNKAETVQFAKGKSDATLTRTISPESSIDFIMNAKKGQTMDFTVGYDFNDSDIEAFLTEPGLQDISLTTGPKKPNEFKVTTSGNHRLTVHNTTKKAITMTLYLGIN